MEVRSLALFGLMLSLGSAHATQWDNHVDSLGVINLAHRAHSILSETLRDYPTTRFQHVTAHYTSEPTGRFYLLCGELNTKNGFGGYTGWQGFGLSLDPKGSVELWFADDPKMTETVTKVCYGDYPGRVDDTRGVDYSRQLQADF